VRALGSSEVLFLHAQLAQHLGQPRGVADVTALAAALAEVEAAVPADLFELAATLAGTLAHRRPFAAANLALAAAAAGLLLRQYDLDVRLDAAEMPALRPLLAADDRAALATWLRAHAEPLPRN
jgi:prophage maintenance system killer protein